jgi:hypothetical protein
MSMTVTGHVRDWTYRAARLRMVRAGRATLPLHIGAASVDDRGNRMVDCACSWRGNALGWAAHLDNVVQMAIDEDRLP